MGASQLVYPDVEQECTTRGCTGYQPSQMWYMGRDGTLQSGNYTASINEQWLTSMVPSPSRRCLSAVHSADMAGTPAGDTEIWGGALANGSLVLALCNRNAPNGTTIKATLSLLFERHAFFSFAMLSERSARAAGYAHQVAHDLAGSQQMTTTFRVRDVLSGEDLPSVLGNGSVSARVDTGDTKLILLVPVGGSSN